PSRSGGSAMTSPHSPHHQSQPTAPATTTPSTRHATAASAVSPHTTANPPAGPTPTSSQQHTSPAKSSAHPSAHTSAITSPPASSISSPADPTPTRPTPTNHHNRHQTTIPTKQQSNSTQNWTNHTNSTPTENASSNDQKTTTPSAQTDQPVQEPSPIAWQGYFTPAERAWIRKVAFLRAHGHDWNHIADTMQVPLDTLLERLDTYQHYFTRQLRCYEREHYRQACREACMRLRQLLRSGNGREATKAAQILVQLEMNRYRYRPRPARRAAQGKEGVLSAEPLPGYMVSEEEVCRRRAAEEAEQRAIVQAFPNTARGRLARDVYLLAQDMTLEEITQRWEEMFRRECFKRRIRIPGVEEQEYWLREGYAGEEAVGWGKDDPVYGVYMRLRREGVVDYHTLRERLAGLCGVEAADVCGLRERCRLLLVGPWGEGVVKRDSGGGEEDGGGAVGGGGGSGGGMEVREEVV
ncbi:MAG: hypothetical protein RMJ88_16855, partial [Thermogemmata sp.]|nr:hypothetical protein [Thermogemmata sp.]